MRDFSKVKRIVVKVGTNLLTDENGINEERIKGICSQLADLKNMGYQVILVSSGAIGMGAKVLKHTNPVVHIPLRQAFAAIGNPMLMSAYQRELDKYNIIAAQVLITKSVLNNRRSYVNLRSSVSTLLALGTIPIFNENDVVSTAEIGNVFGDNDRMSAMVASKIEADLLILLTDIDGIYTSNPKKDKDATLIRCIDKITPEIMSYAKGKGSAFSTGGMKTKLYAAEIAQDGGCATIIASGYEPDVLTRVVGGEEIGTLILPSKRLSARERWIMDASINGTIVVDDGAKRALFENKSLLPSGIVSVKGNFNEKEVVLVTDRDGNGLLKAVTNFNSSDLRALAGHKSSEIGDILGKGRKDVIFRPEDLVFTDCVKL